MAIWRHVGTSDEILEPGVVPFLRNNGDATLFQQDNARAHSARLTMNFFNQNGVQVLPWPAFSPELNPIKHLWDQLGKRVYSRCHPPINRQQLAMALQKKMDNITQDQIQRLTSKHEASMPSNTWCKWWTYLLLGYVILIFRVCGLIPVSVSLHPMKCRNSVVRLWIS